MLSKNKKIGESSKKISKIRKNNKKIIEIMKKRSFVQENKYSINDFNEQIEDSRYNI